MNAAQRPDAVGGANTFPGLTGETPVAARCDAMIGARAAMREAISRYDEAQERAAKLLAEHLARFMTTGSVVGRGDRVEWTRTIGVTRGNDRKATRYELAEPPHIDLARGRDPSEADWHARAHPLNAAGERMNGNTHGTGTRDGTVTIGARLFPAIDPNDEVSADDYEQFCDAYVDNWMRSSPADYRPLRPSNTGDRKRISESGSADR
jgi:hypothetical protein